jgi:hypothetical protein
MKSPQEKKDRKRNPQMVQTPEHDKPGRIMSPPPFELDASWSNQPVKRKDEEEEIVEEGKEGKEQK